MSQMIRRSGQYVRPVIVHAGLALTLASGCHSSPNSAAWRQEQEFLIAETVLQDLADMPPLSDNDARSVFCVAIGASSGPSASDPQPALLQALRRRLAKVVPASDCELRGTVVHKHTAEYAMLLSVGKPEWKHDDFVRITGWRFVSPAAAGEWAFTLSLTQGRWRIDTAKLVSMS